MIINPYIELKESKIHHKGVFALKDIPPYSEIIEFTGKIITLEEAESIKNNSIEKSKLNPSSAKTYIFELSNGSFLDGDIPTNYAKYINHSCDPNCRCVSDNNKLIIITIKEINKGEEITFNYGFSFDENYKDHPCKCGSTNCIGFILAEHEWPNLKNHLKKII